MSAFFVSSLSTASPAPAPTAQNLAGVAGRSTASVRSRYRRQTAVLMLGTTFVGLWMALAAPSTSPVTPVTPPAVVGVGNPGAGDPPTGPTAPLRRNGQLTGDGPRGRDGFEGHRR